MEVACNGLRLGSFAMAGLLHLLHLHPRKDYLKVILKDPLDKLDFWAYSSSR
jgi:hypothetical protein